MSMRRQIGKDIVIVALVASASLLVLPPIAHPCGLKLVSKRTKGKAPIKRSPNPGRVLLLGSPSAKVEKALKKAGHQVEVAQDAQEAQGKDFDIVAIDSVSERKQVTDFWPDAEIVSISRSSRTMLASVETARSRNRITQQRIAAKTRRPPVRTGPDRVPIDASKSPSAIRNEASRDPAIVPITSKAELSASENIRKPSKVEEEPTTKDKPEQPLLVSMEVGDSQVKPARNNKVVKTRKSQPLAAMIPVEKVKPSRAQKSKSLRLFFRLGSSLADKSAVKRISKHLKNRTDVSVRLEGHTDSSGPSEYNLDLSQKRVESIRQLLIDRGVSPDKIEAVGYGEERPPFSPPSSSKNRCVVVTWLP